MNARELIARMLTASDQKAMHVSLALDRSPGYVSAVARQGNPSTNTLARIARECGYTIYAEGHGERIEIEPPAD